MAEFIYRPRERRRSTDKYDLFNVLSPFMTGEDVEKYDEIRKKIKNEGGENKNEFLR